jgi:hypothetical protein
MGRAQQLVRPERYDDMARALLTLVHTGLTAQLSNTRGPAEQVRRGGGRKVTGPQSAGPRTMNSAAFILLPKVRLVVPPWSCPAVSFTVHDARICCNVTSLVQMVVVLDCRGGSSVGLTRHLSLLKRLAVTMNQHYPVGWLQNSFCCLPAMHQHWQDRAVLCPCSCSRLAG